MFFVQMIGRLNRNKCLPPEVSPLRTAFYIYPHMSVSVKYPCKYLLIAAMPDYTPVLVLKRVVLKNIGQGQAEGDGFFFSVIWFPLSILYLFHHFLLFLLETPNILPGFRIYASLLKPYFLLRWLLIILRIFIPSCLLQTNNFILLFFNT